LLRAQILEVEPGQGTSATGADGHEFFLMRHTEWQPEERAHG